ncbi:hypothetical protein VTK26DRAFT_8830 [Humicola hyalothermophila]
MTSVPVRNPVLLPITADIANPPYYLASSGEVVSQTWSISGEGKPLLKITQGGLCSIEECIRQKRRR